VNQIENQTLALAGMFQAAVLTDALAITGSCDQSGFECSFNSLFTFDAHSSMEVFGELEGLQQGFEALIVYLGGANKGPSKNIAYYVLSMLKLGSTLLQDHALAENLQLELLEIESSAEDYDLSRNNVLAKIGGLYQDNISQLSPRIMVRGDQSYLSNEASAARIRTLLLGGIRAAVLWHQLGGSKWRLLWSRKKYVVAAGRLLRVS